MRRSHPKNTPSTRQGIHWPCTISEKIFFVCRQVPPCNTHHPNSWKIEKKTAYLLVKDDGLKIIGGFVEHGYHGFSKSCIC